MRPGGGYSRLSRLKLALDGPRRASVPPRGTTYPEHVVDQRELYEDYGFLDMPHAREDYTAQPESVDELTYEP